MILPLILGTSCQDQGKFRESPASLSEHQLYRFKLEEKLDFELPKVRKLNFAKILGRTPKINEVELGRMLFNDPILSRNNDISCATCHLSNHGFADGNTLTVGAGGEGGPDGNNVGKMFGTGQLSLSRNLGSFGFGHSAHRFMFRNSLSTLNVAYRMDKAKNKGLFWDGRFGDLLFQVLLPIHTPEEMCGTNPIVKTDSGDNPFRKGGALFPRPITIFHTNSYDEFTGNDTGNFNSQPITIEGIPYRRKNNQISVPNRNECLALAISKISQNKAYQKLFKEAFGTDSQISDKTLAMALQSFIVTHVANDTPYDRMLMGEALMSKKELKGMVRFFLPANEVLNIKGQKIKGAGCYKCHDSAQFGGNSFASLGVRSDLRSALSRNQKTSKKNSGFFDKHRTQRGLLPSCHIEGLSVSSSGYAPDIGHASVSLKKADCFKMRVPPLRNVIETFPYFHHGTANLKGREIKDPIKRSLAALDEVVAFHLEGPRNVKQLSRQNPLDPFYDPYQQLDYLIPYYSVYDPEDPRFLKVNFDKNEREEIVHFIAFSLWDPRATQRGELGNDVSHPKRVPSGLSPSITRESGTQLDTLNLK